MMPRVTDNEAVSESFAMTNGAKQGSVLTFALSSLMCFVMLADVFSEACPLMDIVYRANDQSLNIRRMQATTRPSTTNVHYLLFADEYALNTVTVADMQRNMNHFTAGYAHLGLIINPVKTAAMHRPISNTEKRE
ncbi:hypothetical protein SprV_0301193100 [Sparganum proliferum]